MRWKNKIGFLSARLSPMPVNLGRALELARWIKEIKYYAKEIGSLFALTPAKRRKITHKKRFQRLRA
jgi:hypothetical protein